MPCRQEQLTTRGEEELALKKNSGAKIRTAWLRIPPLLFSAEHGPLSASGILFLLENWGRTLFSHIRGGGGVPSAPGADLPWPGDWGPPARQTGAAAPSCHASRYL